MACQLANYSPQLFTSETTLVNRVARADLANSNFALHTARIAKFAAARVGVVNVYFSSAQDRSERL